jgi:hypothetical protein
MQKRHSAKVLNPALNINFDLFAEHYHAECRCGKMLLRSVVVPHFESKTNLNNFGDSSCQEIPDNESSVVAADGEEGTVPIELAAYGHRDAIESAIVLLGVILTKRFWLKRKTLLFEK